MDLVAMGQTGLKGWRRKAADPVARQVAKRTSLDEAQVRALIGAAFLALAVITFARTMAEVVRAGRAATEAA
jgi:hypothetical protein